jgi:hypothetical protein
MFEERPMPPEPEDNLERMFAAEEAAIHDDGFTRRLMEQAGKTTAWRRTAICGAGIAGFGFAIGGITEMAPYLPKITGWLDGATNALATANVAESIRGASDATQLAIVAVIAGLIFLVTAVAAVQSR